MPGITTKEDLFKTTTLTEAINVLPGVDTKIAASGLFVEKNISTTSATFDSREGVLTLVGTSERGSDPALAERKKAKTRIISSAHLAEADVVLAQDLQDLREFGDSTSLQQQAQVVNDRLEAMKMRLDVTREWHRMGALRGQVMDADGSVIADLFDLFGVQQHTAACALGTATTDVRKKILTARRVVEKSLGGLMVSGWRAYCSADFFDALTGHANVKSVWENWQASEDRNGGDMRRGFSFAGVEFIEYNATVSGREFVESGKAYMFPVVCGLYKMYNAPADWNETVNTMGMAFYAKAEPRPMNKGYNLEAQSNPLAVCVRPDVLTELSAS